MGRHEIFENAETLLTDQEVQRAAIFPFGTPMSARQEARGAINEPGFDAAVAVLVTRPEDSTQAPQVDVADLPSACLDQVKRLGDWDSNPGSLTEEESDAEMDRWGALFRQVIDTPSADLRDLAGKAHLMLADLNRFHPLEEKNTDDYRLMRVILAEAMAFGGLTDAGSIQSETMPAGTVTLTLPGKARIDADASLVALAPEFEAAQAAWLQAAAANDEPHDRFCAHIDAAKARGGSTVEDFEAAWALPGVQSANALEESTYVTVADLARTTLRMRPRTPRGLAIQARAVTTLVWLGGNYAADAALGDGEDLDKWAIRALIESCVSLAKAGHAPSGIAQPISPSDDDKLSKAIRAHEEAWTAFGHAAAAADRIAIRQAGGNTSEAAMAPLTTAKNRADAAELQAWRDVFKARPSTLLGLLRLLQHTAEHYDSNRDMADAPDVFGALIGAVEGLRFATQARPAEYDLSRLSIAELESLAGIAQRQREGLVVIENMRLCRERTSGIHTPIGEIIEAEDERFGFLGDYAVQEIERRRPTNKDDINRRLKALVRHDLTCNGYIEPELMTEVVQAWSAR